MWIPPVSDTRGGRLHLPPHPHFTLNKWSARFFDVTINSTSSSNSSNDNNYYDNNDDNNDDDDDTNSFNNF